MEGKAHEEMVREEVGWWFYATYATTPYSEGPKAGGKSATMAREESGWWFYATCASTPFSTNLLEYA